MNIFGEGFPKEIINQVTNRQKAYGSGYSAISRTPEEISYLNANSSWCKLISSVDVKDTELLNNPTIKQLGLKDTELAKKFVLFNGTSEFTSENNYNQRSGVANSNTLIGGNSAYGIGGTDFGLRPMMGIQSISVSHENRGSLRRATVKIKAWNKAQFEIIDVLYLRLGFSVLLEWGNSIYFDNNGSFQPNQNNSLDSIFINPGSKTYNDVLKLIQEQRIASAGNYDAMFAKVTNFHWSFMPDGSYDITVDLSSIGDIIESLKINVLLDSQKYVSIKDQKANSDTSDLNTSELIDLYASKHTIGSFLYFLKFQVADFTENLSLESDYIPDFLEEIVQSQINTVLSGLNESNIGSSRQKVTNPESADSYHVSIPKISKTNIQTQKNLINTINNLKNNINKGASNIVDSFLGPIDDVIGWDLENGVKIFSDTPELTDIDVTLFEPNHWDAVSIDWDNYGIEYYVRLGTFLQFLQNTVMLQVKDASVTTPLLKFDFETDTNLMYVDPLQVSVDPRVCMVNKDLKIGNKTYVYIPGGDPFINPDLKTSIPDTDYGRIMNIYLNFTFILKKLEELKDDKNRVPLIDFLQGLLQGVNTALGGINDFDVFIDETTNTVKVIDKNPLPNLNKVIDFYKDKTSTYPSLAGKELSTELAEFKLYGYDKNQASFIKDFNFTTELTPEFSTMITVGAAANGTVVGENDTALSKLNKGLEDRFKKEVTNGSLGTSGAASSAASGVGALGSDRSILDIKEKYQKTYLEYIKFLITLSPTDSDLLDDQQELNPDEIDTYKDTLTNLIQMRLQYQKERDRRKNNDKSPTAVGTGFIPFNLSITMDGLSGMKINQKFTIDTRYLPSNYPTSVEFLIKNIQHEVSNNKWFTKLESYCISKGDESFKDDSDSNLDPGSASQGATEVGTATSPDVPVTTTTTSPTTGFVKTLTSGFDLSSSTFRKTETVKNQIYLHHTAGAQRSDKGKGTVDVYNNRASNGNPASTHAVIDKDGHIEYLFDDKYVSFHAGVKGTRVPNNNGLSVELQSYGALTKKGSEYYNAYGGKIPASEVALAVDINGNPKAYKNYTYYHKYTPAQILAVKKLILNWSSKHSIPVKWLGQKSFDILFPPNDKNGNITINKEALTGTPGLYTHNSVRTDKTDVFPQKELIEMLKTL